MFKRKNTVLSTLKILLIAPLFTLMTLLVTPSVVQAATPPDSCFNFDSVTGTINDYYDNEANNSSNPACPKDVDIASAIGGSPVTSIGNSAFYNNQLTAITIPNSVTSIGNSAFYNNQLTAITIPNSVTSIGDSAFGNNQLTAITIPNSVTSIGYGTFENNQLTSATIPNSVTSIGGSAFYNNQLTAITIPNSVTSIGYGTFENNQLTSATIPNSVTSIGNSAFGSNQLTAITIPNSVTSIGNSAFGSNQLTSATIPNSVTSIGGSAFYNNQLTAITIPNSVTSIGSAAFAGNQLTTVNIPSSVTNMGIAAFAVQSTLGGSWETEVGSGDPARAQALMDRIWYARLYTADPSNPNGLADELLTEVAIGGDLNGDGDQSDSVGGHLINPAQVTLGYENGANNQLQPDTVYTGNGLSDYLGASNPTNDFSLYYRLGSSQNFTPPAISGFTTPSAFNLVLADANTRHTFIYSAQSGGDNGNSSDSGGNNLDPNSNTSSNSANTAANDNAETLAETGLNQELLLVVALLAISAASTYLVPKLVQIRRT